MLNNLAIKPPLTELYKLINQIPGYPVDNRQLIEFASKAKAPKEVVDFYRTFSDSRVYRSKDELAAISEQVDLLRQEEAEAPREIERGPEDY